MSNERSRDPAVEDGTAGNRTDRLTKTIRADAKCICMRRRKNIPRQLPEITVIRDGLAVYRACADGGKALFNAGAGSLLKVCMPALLYWRERMLGLEEELHAGLQADQ